jgi:hypothetical protein
MTVVSPFDEIVSTFGASAKAKLAGPGDREAAIRSPIERLVTAVATELGLTAVPYDEVRDTDRAVRPDYAIAVDGVITGYIEVKKPGASVDPDSFSGHNKRQWERQRDLPNLIYTNGTEWRLWRDGEPVVTPVHLGGGPLEKAGATLTAPASLESLLIDFLRWRPAPITNVLALVRAIAPLTRLLRGEVIDQLAEERRAVAQGAAEATQPFLGLAKDWRALLFPTASDEVFADGYAQAVTFALLLARTEDIELTGSLHEVGTALGGAEHSLMGRALQLLTDHVAADFAVTLRLLTRVVGAVDWQRVQAGKRDAYLYLYEDFLDYYDNDLRKQSGSYYTPHQIVEQMVRLTEDALVTRFERPTGFADPEVWTVDPAMGTGTYLHEIIARVSTAVEAREGPGSVPAAVASLAERLVGFEQQMGPYAVAELRTSGLLHGLEASLPLSGMKLYVADTLDDPDAEIAQLGSGLELIAASRRRANDIKRRAHVTVVIGNPPYRERAEGMGGWVESGNRTPGAVAPLDAFRASGNGLSEYVLKNLYVYFWRWATWKVFDAHRDLPDADTGIVCFITTSGYLRGPGFKGMREYLRRTCSEGWVIDLTPEGQTPDVPTRVFPGVRQPLAIGLFVRTADTNPDAPAMIRYRAVAGRQADKFAALEKIGLDDDGWRLARTAWQAPLTPAAQGAWDEFPALADLLPWVAPGVKANRTWVYAPAREILDARWRRLVTEPDREEKRRLFKESDSAKLDLRRSPMPGTDTYQSAVAFDSETGPPPAAVRVGFRSFDRQWLIPDARLIHRPSPDLWHARVGGQVFLVEQHSKAISTGPGVVFSALIPDMDHFKGSEGGRALPLLHPGGRPNVAPGLLDALAVLVGGEVFAGQVTAEDLLAYVAAVVAHPGYTARFADELTTPGIRVPLTADPALWAEAVELGRNIVWAHTYGESMADAAEGRPPGEIRFAAGDPRRVLNVAAVTGMPTGVEYDETRQQVWLGSGAWGPVRRAVFDYAVGGKNVVRSWVNYRKAVPGGKKSSPLDDVHVDTWPAEWSVEFTDLLTVLTRLVDAEPAQQDLLVRVLAGPILTMPTLAEHGARWPTTAADRKPDLTAPVADESPTDRLF